MPKTPRRTDRTDPTQSGLTVGELVITVLIALVIAAVVITVRQHSGKQSRLPSGIERTPATLPIRAGETQHGKSAG